MTEPDTFTIILNNTHCSNTVTNMEYTFNFYSGFIVKKGAKICLTSLSIPYSWYNISAQYTNNSFSYMYAGTQFDITIPDGYYNGEGLLAYFQQIQIERNQYLIDTSTGEYRYFINFIQNINTYSNQFYFYPIPTIDTIPDGYTVPDNFVYSMDGSCPQLIINNKLFGSLIGYLPGTYPEELKDVPNDVVGNTIPNLSPVSCMIMRCTMIDNSIGFPQDILTSIPLANSSFGSNIIFNPNYPNYVSLKEGTYPNMTITLNDQNFNNIYANDNNVCINLTLKQ